MPKICKSLIILAALLIGVAPVFAQTFVDVTTPVGLGGNRDGNGAAWGDFDRDGDPDLFVAGLSGNRLFRNDSGLFVDVTAVFGLDRERLAAKSASWADFDNDGDLDLLIVNNSGQTKLMRNRRNAPFVDMTAASGLSHTGFGGRALSDYDRDGDIDIFLTTAAGSALYRNNGDWTFTNVSNSVGITDKAFGICATFTDLVEDLQPDLYVGSLLPAPALLYRNNSGNFTDIAPGAGVNSEASNWAAAWADYDNDGDFDLYVARDGVNSLYRNNGNYTFTDVAAATGTARSGQSSGVTWGDYNTDGWLDLYVTGSSGNRLYRNNANSPNNTFSDATTTAGPNVDGQTRDATFADFDGDGDADLFLVNDSGYQLFRNVSSLNKWTRIELIGTRSSSDAIGAHVHVTTPGGTQKREVSSNNGLYGQNDLALSFGLSSQSIISAINVHWLNGDSLRAINPTVARPLRLVQPYPNLWLNEEVHTFKNQLLNTSKTDTILISNPAGDFGGADLVINRILPTHSAFTVSPNADLALLRNGRQAVRLTFAPADTGLISGEIRIQSNDPQGDFRLEVNGRGVAPYIKVDSLRVDFGGARLGRTLKKTLEISNAGNAALTVNQLVISNPVFTAAASLPLVIEAYSRRTIEVTFTPTAVDTARATLTIISDDFKGARPTVQLIGRGQAPIIVAAARLDFGNVPLDSTAILPLSITNTGQAELLVYDIDSSDNAFSADLVDVLIVPPGEERRVGVRFSPRQIGPATALLTLQSDAVNGKVNTLVTGTGIAPLLDTAASLAFGSIAMGDSVTQPLTIRNIGPARLEINAAVTDQPAFRVNLNAPISIPPNSQTQLQLTFKPVAEGAQNGRLFLFSNDPQRNPYIVSMTGTGLAAHAEVSPIALDFGDVGLTQSNSRDLTIRNNGQATLTFGTLQLPPAFAVIQNWPPAALASGNQITLNVIFTPTEAREYSEILQFTTNDPARPAQAVVLRGRGVSGGQLAYSPKEPDFGNAAVGTRDTLAIELFNFGGAPLTIHAYEFSNTLNFRFAAPFQGLTLLSLERENLAIVFSPTQIGLASGTLRLSVDRSFVTIVLRGQGVRDTAPPVLSGLANSLAVDNNPVRIEATATDNVAIQTARVRYRPGGGNAYDVETMVNSGGNRYAGTIPANAVTARGLEYYVEAIDPSDNLTVLPSPARPNIIQVQVLNLSRSAAQPSESYRLISVPLQLDNTDAGFVFSNEFGLYDPTEWRLWQWTGQVREYAENSWRLEPGHGYWLINKLTRALDTQPARGLSIITGEPFRLVLQPGWNIVATPFAFAIDWTTVTLPAGVENALWGRTANGYQPATQLQPWEGYFVRNNNSTAVTLELPPHAIDGAVTARSTPSAKGFYLPPFEASPEDETVLQFSAMTADTEDNWNFAVLGDRLPVSEPPTAPENAVQLYFERTGRKLAIDATPVRSDTFRLIVRHNFPQIREVTLNFAAPNLPVNMDWLLIDEALRTPVAASSYRFVAASEQEYAFKLIVGSTEAIAAYKTTLPAAPASLRLYPNWPNPFRDVTAIRFYLPQAAPVSLSIYNVAGQLVQTLCSEQTFEAGYQQLFWQGDTADGKAASGVYVLALQAAGQQITRQLLLLQ